MTDYILSEVRSKVIEVLLDLIPDLPSDLLSKIEVSLTQDIKNGEISTNAALVVSKYVNRPAKDIASDIVMAMYDPKIIETSMAGPGFVNMILEPTVWQSIIPIILQAEESYGNDTNKNIKVNVEYVSANPTGPLHIGHCRGAVVGDALSNLLSKSGYQVTKEYYINDAGNQVQSLAWATFFRYLQLIYPTLTAEDFSSKYQITLEYLGEYLIPVAQKLRDIYEDVLMEGDITLIKDFVIKEMLDLIDQDLSDLGINHDVFASEKDLIKSGAVDKIISYLKEKDLIYTGILEPPKGKIVEDYDQQPQLLFKAKQFGDDSDRVLQKADGSNTYFSNDIAYHAQKINQGADILINVLGADHSGYLSRMKSAVKAINENVKLESVICQIVHVLKNGIIQRQSKRAGTYYTLRDLLDEVGPDAIRYTMLTRKSDTQMEFDIDKAIAQTRDNPVYYVQYAHARCRSVIRTAVEDYGINNINHETLSKVNLSTLIHPLELALMRRLAIWPRVVNQAATNREPHRITNYLHDLASDFHNLWNGGTSDPSIRFLQLENHKKTFARVALVAATAITIRSAFRILGVNPIEQL